MGNQTLFLKAALGKKFWWLVLAVGLLTLATAVLWPDSAALLLGDGDTPKPGSGG